MFLIILVPGHCCFRDKSTLSFGFHALASNALMIGYQSMRFLFIYECSFINFFYGHRILVPVDAVNVFFFTDEQVDDMVILLSGNLQSLMLYKLLLL